MLKLLAFIAMLGSNSSYQNADSLNRKELMCLSTAVYHEARGEPVMGQIAVAHTVMNRVKSSSYPDTVCEVIYQSNQFTDIEHVIVDYSSSYWKNAIEYATLSYIGFVDDPTGAAMFYHNPGKVTPKHYGDECVRYAVNEVRIRNHLFYNLKKR